MARRTRHEALITALLARRPMASRYAPAQERDAAGRTWYRIENKDGGSGGNASAPVEVFLYAEIGMWGVTADMFLDELAPIGARDITLRVNSEGGEVFDGVAIYNALQRHAGRIVGHVDGLAASAASFIMMACDEVIVEPGGQMMIHDAIGMCYGNEAEMEKMRNMLARTSDTIAMIYAERAGGDPADWREIMRGERWYDGAGAVEARLADRVGEGRPRDTGTGQKTPDNRVSAGPANYDASQPRDPNTGRWLDGMPDVIASYAFATAAGSLRAARTREGVELHDGAHGVTLRPNELRRVDRAMRSSYDDKETLINRHVEIDGKMHSVTVARVRPSGRGQSEDGEDIATGMRLDIGQVEDSDDYDSRTGVLFTAAQAERFEDVTGRAEVAERVQTGYGPLDLYPTAAGDGMALRMKAESGNPTEVEFSRAEWKRINAAIDTLIDGGDESTPDGETVNAITVRTKAGKVDLEWKGGRTDRGYPADARLMITPQYDAVWSVVIDGEHMSEAFEPIGHINDAIGVTDRRHGAGVLASGRRRHLPVRGPLAVRHRPGTHAAPGGLPITWNRDLDGTQPRGDDGKWVEGLPDTNSIDMERYAEMYDVHDETTTEAGVTIVTMADGDMQWSMDYADEPDTRDVLMDLAPEDMEQVRDALRQVVDADDDADVSERDVELLDPETDEVWFNASRADGVITIFVPGVKESRDFSIDLDVLDAEEAVDAIDEQLARSRDITGSPADTWSDALIALTTPVPVSSSADDHPMAFWEANA